MIPKTGRNQEAVARWAARWEGKGFSRKGPPEGRKGREVPVHGATKGREVRRINLVDHKREGKVEGGG